MERKCFSYGPAFNTPTLAPFCYRKGLDNNGK
jgi:hypothetical protein